MRENAQFTAFISVLGSYYQRLSDVWQ